MTHLLLNSIPLKESIKERARTLAITNMAFIGFYLVATFSKITLKFLRAAKKENCYL